VQILQSVVYKYIDISGRNTCTLVSSPVLDTVYPYGGSTLNKPGDSTVDGPGKGLAPSRGRVSRVFQRYNVPDVDFTGPYRPYPVPEWKCLHNSGATRKCRLELVGRCNEHTDQQPKLGW